MTMAEDTCGIYIHQIHNTIEKSVNNQLRKSGLTYSQMNLLVVLVSNPNKKVSFKELEKKLSLAQSTTAGLISRLEQKGLVYVIGDKGDKRIKYVQITDQGIQYCKDARTDMQDTEKKLVSSLTDEEKKTFLTLLKKVNDSLLN